MKLQLTGLVVRDVGLTKRKYFQPNVTACTHTTATVTIITTSVTTSATKGLATTINSTANATSTIIKAKYIKVKIFGMFCN